MTSTSSDSNNKNANSNNSNGSCEGCGCFDRCALKINNYIERAFCAVGYYIGEWPYMVIGLVLLFLSLCCIGFAFTEIETNLFDLWTPTDSPVFDEEQFVDYYWKDSAAGTIILTAYAKSGEDTNILREEYINEWYQIHLDLSTKLPTKNYSYVAADNSIQQITFGLQPKNFEEPKDLQTLAFLAQNGQGPSSYHSEIIPLCQPFSTSPLEAQFIMPCYHLSIFDCFSEGGYWFPYDDYLKYSFFANLVPANLYTYLRDSFVGKDTLQLGETLGPSCQVFTGNGIPSNFIYGGETRLDENNQTSTLLSVNSFQTLMQTDSASNIARKIKIATGKCVYTSTYGISCPEITDEEVEEAQEFLDDWLLDYIDFMKDYAQNLDDDDSKLFRLQFFTPRTTGDLLSEASSADFGLLAIAYVAMIVFASLTAINFGDWFLSRSEASFAGVLLVLFSVIATVGLGSFMQIKLSPNIIQVLPFIALGFGVDDMFVLLFSFKYRERLSVKEMIAETTRIAGSSVALTSLANFTGFIVGTTMVLPDVARFATFGAIVVMLNFISIIFGFTAVLTLVARRMKNEYNDWSWLFCWASFTRADKITSEKPSSVDASIFDPLFDWLTKTGTRVTMLICFIALIVTGAYGCTLISPGLPLADIVPETAYAADFLRIREMFYHSYPISLYTDADGADFVAIDWENKFEDWLNATQDIYSISDNVYEAESGVNSFWAWGFRDYLAEKHASRLNGEYALQPQFDIAAALAGETPMQELLCYEDVDKFCSNNERIYEFESDLFNCLVINYGLNNLDTDCAAFVYAELVANTDLGVARQIYVTSFEDDGNDINGLYARPSTNDIKVFMKYPDMNGIIYQSDCKQDLCPWYILDEAFNVLYIGEPTASTDDGIYLSYPAQNGWKSADGASFVSITHTVYDYVIGEAGVDRDVTDYFIQSDVQAFDTFSFSNMYSTDPTTLEGDSACKQFEVMQLLMTETSAFKQVSMQSNVGNSDVVCNAVLEASEICKSIRDGSDLGAVECGKDEPRANLNLWYTGMNDGNYQIVSTPNHSSSLPISQDTFTSCEDSSLWQNNEDFVYNFFTPCGGANFGGFGLTQNESLCNTEAQTIDLQCDAFNECENDLRVCFDDWNTAFQTNVNSGCGIISSFDSRRDDVYLADLSAQCSFRFYNSYSKCCQTAIKEKILSLPSYPCSRIANTISDPNGNYTESFAAVCQATDQCVYDSELNTCTEKAIGNVFDECNLFIQDGTCSLDTLNLTKSDVRSGNQSKFTNCLATNVIRSSLPPFLGFVPVSGSDNCNGTFVSQSAIYPNCLYPVDSFWDFDTMSYDYAMCTDADISNLAQCGTTNNGTNAQLECLKTNVDSLPVGCCKLAIETIASPGSYSVTKECEVDVAKYCAAFGVTSAGSALAAAANNVCIGDVCPGELCLNALFTNQATDTLSPKCKAAMGYCEANGDWPATPVGTTVSRSCGNTSLGVQTRTCLAEIPLVTWGEVNATQCEVLLTCPEILAADDADYNQYWPETAVNSVYKIQGGAVNSLGTVIPDQVSAELQAYYMQNGTNAPCNPSTGFNDWYARRACLLDPYTKKPTWQEPEVECKPFTSYWNNVQNHTVCDFLTEQITQGFKDLLVVNFPALEALNLIEVTKKANLIDVIPWSVYDETEGVTTTKDQQIGLSQQYCTSSLTNCAAFSYDDVFGVSYFFDYCPTISSEDMQGFIPEIIESPAYTFPGLMVGAAALATSQGQADPCSNIYGTNVTLTPEAISVYAAQRDSIFEAFAPDGTDCRAIPYLNTFADRHTTYIAPLDQTEFTATYCSLKSIPNAATGGFISPYTAWNEKGIPRPECFNNTLWMYYIDPTGGVLTRDDILFVDPAQTANVSGFDNVQILTTSNSLYVKNIDDDEAAVDFILDLRKRLDEWSDDRQLYTIPDGLVINLYSQYIGVSSYLVENLVYVSIAIAICGMLFLLNPIAVIIALLCNTAMVIEVYGFSDWIGLRINGVLVLNIVIAVALTMEFTAHIGRAFVLTTVTKKDKMSSIALPFSNEGQIRMKKTLREMFTPVSLGALTTIIGVAPIAAAQFPYFRQYYFSLYVMIVLFGWLNGVIFQVVLLSFFPPKPFVEDVSYLSSDEKRLMQHQELGDAEDENAGTQTTKATEMGTKVENDGNETTTTTNDGNNNVEIKRKHTREAKDAP